MRHRFNNALGCSLCIRRKNKHIERSHEHAAANIATVGADKFPYISESRLMDARLKFLQCWTSTSNANTHVETRLAKFRQGIEQHKRSLALFNASSKSEDGFVRGREGWNCR